MKRFRGKTDNDKESREEVYFLKIKLLLLFPDLGSLRSPERNIVDDVLQFELKAECVFLKKKKTNVFKTCVCRGVCFKRNVFPGGVRSEHLDTDVVSHVAVAVRVVPEVVAVLRTIKNNHGK